MATRLWLFLFLLVAATGLNAAPPSLGAGDAIVLAQSPLPSWTELRLAAIHHDSLGRECRSASQVENGLGNIVGTGEPLQRRGALTFIERR